MNAPAELRQMATAVAKEFWGDINAAIDKLAKLARKHPLHKDWLDGLEMSAYQEMVYDARHHMTNKAKNFSGADKPRAKVLEGASPSVKAVAVQSLLDTMYIDGTRLGDIMGKDLPRVIAVQHSMGNGYFRNAALLRRLQSLTPPDKRIRDAVKPARVNKIWKAIQAKYATADSVA